MRKTILLLLIFNFLILGYSQTIKDSLLTNKTYSLNLLGQTNNDSSVFIEKVYLHTDRNYYFLGDDIWFKAYLIDASDRILTNHSNNLHVELISPDSKILNSSVIRLEDGLGNGDFKIAENLPSGKYRIRAYTNYMRNFGDQLFFNKEIFVVSSAAKSNESDKNQKYVNNKVELNFFPEGGSLVDNVASIVAFKAVDATGKSCDVSGKVYSSIGDLITTFKSAHLGMGSFILKPITGLSYYSVLEEGAGTETRINLPKSFDKGVVLNASVNQNNELLITSKTNPQTLPILLNNDLILTISARKIVVKQISFRIRSLTNLLSISTNDLPDGILMLTLSTLENLPICERLIFLQLDNNLKISIQPDKNIYKKREPVSMKLSLYGDSVKQHEAFLSLTAAESNLTDNTLGYPSSITSWFLLESDIRGPVEEPSYYFDPSNQDRIKDLDLLLRTQGWRDFEWKYNNNVGYTREVGFTISGKLRKNMVDKPIPNAKVNIGIFKSDNNILMTVPTDSSGKFRLEGVDLTGEAQLAVTAVGKKGQIQGLLLLDSIRYSPALMPSHTATNYFELKENVNTLEQEYEVIYNIKEKFRLSDTINLGGVTIISKKPLDLQTVKLENSRALYGSPDNELLVTPQLQAYHDPIEMMQGKFPGVDIRKNPSGYTINIRGTHTINGNTQPLFLIDGIKSDMDAIMGLPIQFIDRIDVLKSAGSTALYGMQGTNGVISIITKTAEALTPYIPIDYSKNVKISGYDAPRIFYSPQYTPKSESYNPDLRTTLLWKPDISLRSGEDLLIKYFNGDNSSDIKIIVEGITSTGIPITGKTEYIVK